MKYTAVVTLTFNVEVEAADDASAEELAEMMVADSIAAGGQPDAIDVEVDPSEDEDEEEDDDDSDE